MAISEVDGDCLEYEFFIPIEELPENDPLGRYQYWVRERAGLVTIRQRAPMWLTNGEVVEVVGEWKLEGVSAIEFDQVVEELILELDRELDQKIEWYRGGDEDPAHLDKLDR